MSEEDAESAMKNSILENVKQNLNIPEGYSAFDGQLLTHINYALGTLSQIGLTPTDGYIVVDEESKWNDFLLKDSQTSLVRMYVGLKVRQLFDPPQTGFLSTALSDQIEEVITRLSYSFETPSLTENV